MIKGYTKEDHMRAIAIMLSDDASEEEKKKAGEIALAYQEQAGKDCTVCRFYFDHSSTESGGHDRLCPHHPENYHDLINRVRCIVCGIDTSLSNFGPVGATIWVSRGCYGSRLIDRTGEHDPGTLRIEICDMCLLMNSRRVIDSGSGKWKPWEPHIPPEIKGDRIRIFQDENGKWIGRNYFSSTPGHGDGGYSQCVGDTALEVLEACVNHEKYMAQKGYPMGHKYIEEES